MLEQNLEMRAARSGSAEVLEIRERSLDPPGHGEVQVAVQAAGVAYADIVMRRGLYPGHKPPITPGYDFVGRIERIGAGVTGLAHGQRVVGVTIHGSYATRRNVDARWLVPVSGEADPHALVAAALNGVTAWQLLHRIANVFPGEWILVHGAAGGVGSLLLDLARLAGVRAIGVAAKNKAETIIARGAIPIDYNSEDVAARAKFISGGGVSAVFDHLGGSHFRRISMSALKRTGIGIVYGAYDATRGGTIRPFSVVDAIMNTRFSAYRLFQQSRGIVGYSLPAWRDERTATYRDDLASVVQLVTERKLAPLIGAVFPLARASDAHRALEQRSVAGKIVLSIH